MAEDKRTIKSKSEVCYMKKLLAVLLVLLALGCAAAVAEETTCQSDGFEYALLPNGDAELIRYLGEEGEVTIPNELDGHPITAVRGNPFAVVDENGSVTGIKDCAVSVAADHPYLTAEDGALFGKSDRKLIYYHRDSLTFGDYEIPQGTREIGELAFVFSTGLTGVTIPDTVTAIGEWAFYGCISLMNVTIPDSVTSIGVGAFYVCSSLTSVTIPDSVTSIGVRAFYGCSSLTSVTIPDSVTSIGEAAFANCSGLTSVTIPDSVTSIGEHAFDSTEDYESYSPLPNLVFTVTPGSYAETWCKENGRQYVSSDVEYGDRTDWLPGK